MISRWMSIVLLGCAPASAAPSAREAIDPPAPDYEDPSSWAARPETRDGADVVVPGDEEIASPSADVFFVHPTTYFERRWNAPIDARDAARYVDEVVLPSQASAFNAACRVFAPRYRQATVWAFTTRDFDAAARAIDLAYSDVLRAFEVFVREAQGPFILAAHSQGSYHALRLLAERLEPDDTLRARLVAAYLVGIPLPTDVFERTIPHVPRCASPDQVGCALTWSTVLEGARPSRLYRRLPIFYPGGGGWQTTANKPLACTSPIGGGEGWSEREAHRGAVLFVDRDLRPIAPRVERAIVRARCMDGVLEVERSVPLRYRRDPLALRGDLHLVDYTLFFLDVRADAVRRAEAWSRAQD